MNKKSREYATKVLGFEVYKYSKEIKGNFDLINMSDVVEHLFDPTAFLLRIKKNLSNNRILMITTPDYDKFITKLTNVKPEEHLYYFTKKTITRLLENCGYKILYINNTNRFKFYKLDYFFLSSSTKQQHVLYVLKILKFLGLSFFAEKLILKNLSSDILVIAKPVVSSD